MWKTPVAERRYSFYRLVCVNSESERPTEINFCRACDSNLQPRDRLSSMIPPSYHHSLEVVWLTTLPVAHQWSLCVCRTNCSTGTSWLATGITRVTRLRRELFLSSQNWDPREGFRYNLPYKPRSDYGAYHNSSVNELCNKSKFGLS